MYFDEKGPANTAKVAELVARRAQELGIGHVVVASNSGETAAHFLDKGLEVVCVTHHVGFREPGGDEMPAATREKLAAAGVRLLTTTHLFGNVERAITNKFGGLYPGGIISATLRCFGQGTKVAVEVATMALDAGLIPHGREIIAVGGSGRGADTALVLRPAHAKDFFDLKICEIICKPRYH
ncbi:MAG: pyruvate kinase alpha/beta domain-containing protein [Chloroflexota bacterium]